MTQLLFNIGKIAGITLVLFGFVHILILNKIFHNDNYIKMKRIVGIVTIGLTIITLGCGLGILIIFLIEQI
jgi:hypothetical protein